MKSKGLNVTVGEALALAEQWQRFLNTWSAVQQPSLSSLLLVQ